MPLDIGQLELFNVSHQASVASFAMTYMAVAQCRQIIH